MPMPETTRSDLFNIFISRFSSPIILSGIEEEFITAQDLLLSELFKYHFALTSVIQKWFTNFTQRTTKETAQTTWESVCKSLNKRLFRHEGMIHSLFERLAKALMVLTLDSRFPGLNVHNKAYLLYRLREIIDTAYRELKGQALLNFFASIDFLLGDLNALKPTNEFAGMKNGDKLLYRVAYVMAKSLRIKSFAEKNSLTLTLFALGGDEFAILIQKTAGSIESKSILSKKLSRIVREEVRRIDLTDVFNFANRKVRKKIKKAGLIIPDNFENGGSPMMFRTSIAIGVSNLANAILGLTLGMQEEIDLTIKEEAQARNLSQPQQASLKHFITLNKILGIFLDEAEHGCKKQKARQKKKLRKSENPVDNFLYLLMMRNAEAVELAQQLHKSDKQLAESRSENINLSQELLETRKAFQNSFQLNQAAGQLTEFKSADEYRRSLSNAA